MLAEWKGVRASDGAGPRRNGRGTCNRLAKATHWVAYCDTIWRTCRRRHVGHATIVALTLLTHKALLLRYPQNGQLLQQGRSGTAGENRSPTWATETGRPNRDLRLLDTASWGSKIYAPAAHNHPGMNIKQIKFRNF